MSGCTAVLLPDIPVPGPGVSGRLATSWRVRRQIPPVLFYAGAQVGAVKDNVRRDPAPLLAFVVLADRHKNVAELLMAACLRLVA